MSEFLRELALLPLIMSAQAKAEAKAKSQAPKLLRCEVIPLADISVADDSGWREIDDERCTELQDVILDGSWGATALKGPSLIADDSGKLQFCTIDGKAILFDGKHLVTVLQFLKQDKYLKLPKEQLTWLCEPLEEIFNNGLKMEVGDG